MTIPAKRVRGMTKISAVFRHVEFSYRADRDETRAPRWHDGGLTLIPWWSVDPTTYRWRVFQR